MEILKWYNKLKLILRIYSKRMFTTLLLFTMSVVSFYMIDEVMTEYFANNYMIKNMSSMFGIDPYKVNYVTFLNNEIDTESIQLIKDYIINDENIAGSGCFCNNATTDLIGGEEIPIVISDIGLLKMGNLKLTDEQRMMIHENDDYEPVLLGNNYKDKISIGDVFTLSYENANDCIVVGFLEKNAAWPKRGRLFTGTTNKDSFNLNEQGILLTDSYEKYDVSLGEAWEVYYIVKDNQADAAYNNIMSYALDNKISISITNEGEAIKEKQADNEVTENKTFIAAVLLALLVIISIASSSVIYCLLSRKQYGVMMICGINQSNIIWMIIVQNSIIFTFAAVVAWIIRQRELFGHIIVNQYESNYQLVFMKTYISHNIYIPVVFLIITIIVMIISNLIPVLMIKKMTLIELLYKNE